MTTINTVSLICQVSGKVQPRGDRWAAYAEPSGITVFGDTKQEAIDRAADAVRFFVQTIHVRKGVDVARRYLDSHGVPSQIIESESETPTRYQHEIETSAMASVAA